jgi:hypothetical protein
MPDDMEANLNNVNYLKQRIDDHLVDFLEARNFDQYVRDWDVINEINTNTEGLAFTKAFKGDYEVTLTYGRERMTTSFSHQENQRVTIDCSQLVSLRPEPLPPGSSSISPNPSAGPVNILNQFGSTLDGSMLDGLGRSVWEGRVTPGITTLQLDLPPGSYQLSLTNGRQRSTFTLIRDGEGAQFLWLSSQPFGRHPAINQAPALAPACPVMVSIRHHAFLIDYL